MTDRPILFSGPMVRALIEGRKTQTRRVMNPQPVPCLSWADPPDGSYPSKNGWSRLRYAVGGRLWVREAWRTLHNWDCLAPRQLADEISKITYEADPERRNPLWCFGKLRPSMFMPRWASRLTLTVTEVRVQRLQDISEADAIAEGVKSDVWGSVVPFLADSEAADAHPLDRPVYWAPGDDREDMVCLSARDAYARIWESIHGVGMWGLNEWVAAYTFTVEPHNIDTLTAEAA